MGVYIYTLRRTRPKKTPDGNVYCYRFRERMSKGWSGYINGRYVDDEKRQERNLENYRANFKYTDDCLVCIDGEEGSSVWIQGESDPVWYDCSNVPGEWVGILRKKSGRWYISKLDEEIERARSLMSDYASKHSIELPERVPLKDATEVCYAHFRARWIGDGNFLTVSPQNKEDCESIDFAQETVRRCVDKRSNERLVID